MREGFEQKIMCFPEISSMQYLKLVTMNANDKQLNLLNGRSII